MNARSFGRRRREIANPVLALPAARAPMGLDPARAQKSWAQNKGIMAAYWKAISVYARHIRGVLRAAP